MGSNWRENWYAYGLDGVPTSYPQKGYGDRLAGLWRTSGTYDVLVTNCDHSTVTFCLLVSAGMPVSYVGVILSKPNPASNFPYGFPVDPD